ncbi:MAG: GspH/FimT family pseudopilin [Mariprofundales bacterium]|nr:GspH/FimT family pseudopilin [Mariprofundales bacterium]
MESNHCITPTLRRATKVWQVPAGFTLIEVMVVVAIIGVLVGVAVPGYQSMRDKMNLSGATSTLIGHLKQARHLAISEGRSVAIDLYSSYYTFDSRSSRSRTVKMLSYGGVTLSNNVASNQIVFSSRGTADTGTVEVSTGSICTKMKVNKIGRVYLATPSSPCP